MWLLLCVMTSGIEPPATTDHFDAIELNSYYDEHGNHVFDQIIFRDLDNIADWRLRKSPDQLPAGKRAIWCDGTCLRKVSAASVYHTWTQFDRELEERKELPKENRRELSRPISRQRVRELLRRLEE